MVNDCMQHFKLACVCRCLYVGVRMHEVSLIDCPAGVFSLFLSARVAEREREARRHFRLRTAELPGKISWEKEILPKTAGAHPRAGSRAGCSLGLPLQRERERARKEREREVHTSMSKPEARGTLLSRSCSCHHAHDMWDVFCIVP